MTLKFSLEKPTLEFFLGMSFAEITNLCKNTELNVIKPEEYLVLPKAVSLGGVKHHLGFHLKNGVLDKLELFFFELDDIDTEDEFLYIQNQLVAKFGYPTTSALQDNRYRQNQWIVDEKYEVTNNQSERGQFVEIGNYSGFILTADGMWKPRS